MLALGSSTVKHKSYAHAVLTTLARSYGLIDDGLTRHHSERARHNVAFHAAGSLQHYGFRVLLPGRGARRRKLFRCALRACRPGLRRSAGSAILRGSPSSTDRLPAPRFRCSRGPAQRPLHSTAVVQLEVDMSSMMGLQSISGAFCTSP